MVLPSPEPGVGLCRRYEVERYCTPASNEHHCFGQCVEDLAVQELVPQLAVEALVVAVLPGTTRLDEQRLYTEPGQPLSNQLRRELWPVVRA